MQQNMQQTQAFFLDLTDNYRGEGPVMQGFKPPEPSQNNWFSAPFGSQKGEPENKTRFDSVKPVWYQRIGAIPNKIPSLIDPYQTRVIADCSFKE